MQYLDAFREKFNIFLVTRADRAHDYFLLVLAFDDIIVSRLIGAFIIFLGLSPMTKDN